jgi:hypothetical protein
VYAENYYRFFADLTGRYIPGNPVSVYYSKADALAMNEDNQLFLGNPDYIIDRLDKTQQLLGVDFLLMEVAQGGAPHDKICKTLELFAKTVMRKFQKPQPALKAAR